MTDPTDKLTPLARNILKRDALGAYSRLVVPPQTGNPNALADLQAITDANSLCATFVTNPGEAKAMLAGLWLWHDYLDESHHIAQELHTPSGSFWHAIVHRREGDFGNSKYWYAKAAGHPMFPVLNVQANAIINSQPADKSLLRLNFDGWNNDAFVDLIEQVHDQPADPRHRVAIALQQLEWRLLFDHCARTAQG